MIDPMDLNDVRALLSAIVDDEIDEQVRLRAERCIAQCDQARQLIDETESIDAMLALDAQLLAELPTSDVDEPMLPHGFEQSVLAQTTREAASLPLPFNRRLTTWLGWIAAAASLALAMSIYIIDRQVLMDRSPMVADLSNRSSNRDNLSDGAAEVVHASYTTQSWVLDDPITFASNNTQQQRAEPITDSQAELAIDQAFHPAAILSHMPRLRMDDMFAEPIDASATTETHMQALRDEARQLHDALDESQERSLLSDAQRATIDQTAALMRRLSTADTTSFADLEAIRRTAESQHVLDGIARLKRRADDAVLRNALNEAELLLLRIDRGPISTDELRQMKSDASDQDIATRLNRMTERAGDAS